MASQPGCRSDHLSQHAFDSSETSSMAEPTGIDRHEGHQLQHKVRRPDLELVLPVVWCSAHLWQELSQLHCRALSAVVVVAAISVLLRWCSGQQVRQSISLVGVAQAEPAEMDAHVRTIVRRDVDAAVERLRREFAKGEAMHIQAARGHAQNEYDPLKQCGISEDEANPKSGN